MIILDTGLLSELMCRVPDPDVVAWLGQQPPLSVWIATITFEGLSVPAVNPWG